GRRGAGAGGGVGAVCGGGGRPTGREEGTGRPAGGGGGGGGGGSHLVVAQAPGGTLLPGSATAAPAGAAPAKAQLVDIKSPMVGTFYSAPEPGAGPYVKVGSRVAAGQVVCIIEAM